MEPGTTVRRGGGPAGGSSREGCVRGRAGGRGRALADSATLDCLTFLRRAGRGVPVRVVATCRGDEGPLAAHVVGWLADVRGTAEAEEIRLGPLSPTEVAVQVADLWGGGPVSPQVVEELYARAEGNPFFTEQLVA